jgi:hypothetical protein
MYFNKFKIFFHFPVWGFRWNHPKHSNFLRIRIGWINITIYLPRKKIITVCSECGKELAPEEIEINIKIGKKVPPQLDYCSICWSQYCDHAITGD